jgi:hypothetical protein
MLKNIGFENFHLRRPEGISSGPELIQNQAISYCCSYDWASQGGFTEKRYGKNQKFFSGFSI